VNVYQKILLPLDGSELAECVLPHAESIAKGCGTTGVILVRVVSPLQIRYDTSYSLSEPEQEQLYSQAVQSTQSYLEQVAGRLKEQGLNVTSEVLTGPVAESIAEYTHKNEIDLMIIATHGRSGVSRWVWGSIADKILRSACVPVLMIRAPGCTPEIHSSM
jgi:nucleotide-binding universal stress UspA family protein